MHRHHFQPCAAGKQSHLDSIPAFNNLISLIFTQVQRFSHKNILWMIKRDLLSEQNKSTDKSWIKSPSHALHSHACANQCLSLSEPVTEYSRLPLDKSKPCKGGGSYHHSAPQSFFSTSFFVLLKNWHVNVAWRRDPGVSRDKEGAETITPLYIRRVPLKRLTHCR